MHDFRRLEVYGASVELSATIYELTKSLPSSEEWGLSSQLRRSAVSVPANIAEGAGRGSDREFARFLRIAIGSLCEVESHLDVGIRCGLIAEDEAVKAQADAAILTKRLKVLELRIADRSA